MNVFIFGTGEYYKAYYKWVKHFNIIALLDNNCAIQGEYLDGHKIISPEELKNYDYDRIYILSTFLNQIRDQLLSLGISKDKIFYYFQLLPNNINEDLKFYYSKLQVTNTLYKKKRIVMISHDLSITGAQKCLLLAANILIKNKFHVTVASPYDGDLKEELLSIGADIIIDENLRISYIAEKKWLQDFDILFVNTVQLYYLLLKRDIKMATIWWIHEPEVLYKSVDIDFLTKISKENLKIYTVSDVAKNALYKSWPDIETENLIYGIPDIENTSILNKKIEFPIRFIIIGTISKLKGHDILLDAIALLSDEELSSCEFIFIGNISPAWKKLLTCRINELKLPIKLAYEVDNQTVLKILDTADVLICASRIESMSVAVTEGMMKAIPVIVPNTAGNTRYITDGINGYIFQSQNVQSLKEKISYCIDNRSLLSKVGRNGRETYLKIFSLNSFEKRLLNIITENIK